MSTDRRPLRSVLNRLIGQDPPAAVAAPPASPPVETDDVLDLIRMLPAENGTPTGADSPVHRATITITEADVHTLSAAVIEPADQPVSFVLTPPDLPESPQLVLRREDISERPAFRLSAVDFIRPTQIEHPGNQIQVGSHEIEVCGQAEPGSNLQLRVGEVEQLDAADTKGVFKFGAVPLKEGWNNIYVLSLTYPELDSCHCVVQVYRSALTYIGRRDPYTGSPLGPKDEVVRCRKCHNYARLDSWQQVGCANWGCKSRQYWSKNDPAFVSEESTITM